MALAHSKYPTFETFEDFITWENMQQGKYDLIDGEAVAMAGGSEGHSTIQFNIQKAVDSKLREGGPCRVYNSNMAIKTGVNSGRYPDATIDCGTRNRLNRSLPKPIVVFEVLLPETQIEDRTVKLSE
jgi:Uma2 family endonuclease